MGTKIETYHEITAVSLWNLLFVPSVATARRGYIQVECPKLRGLCKGSLVMITGCFTHSLDEYFEVDRMAKMIEILQKIKST